VYPDFAAAAIYRRVNKVPDFQVFPKLARIFAKRPGLQPGFGSRRFSKYMQPL
jgi:hypothetical protein